MSEQKDLGRLTVPTGIKDGAHEIGAVAGRVFSRVGHQWATDASYASAEEELASLAEKALILRRWIVEERKSALAAAVRAAEEAKA